MKRLRTTAFALALPAAIAAGLALTAPARAADVTEYVAEAAFADVRADLGDAVVNRGFIPYEQRENWKSIAPLPTGTQEIEGLLRQPPASKPGSMMPDNEPQSGTFYWRDIAAMAALSGINPQQLEGWYVDAGFPGKSPDGEYPVKGTTIVSFPNNHLQYAVTWYGLALALFGVGSYFLYSRRKRG